MGTSTTQPRRQLRHQKIFFGLFINNLIEKSLFSLSCYESSCCFIAAIVLSRTYDDIRCLSLLLRKFLLFYSSNCFITYLWWRTMFLSLVTKVLVILLQQLFYHVLIMTDDVSLSCYESSCYFTAAIVLSCAYDDVRCLSLIEKYILGISIPEHCSQICFPHCALLHRG